MLRRHFLRLENK